MDIEEEKKYIEEYNKRRNTRHYGKTPITAVHQDRGVGAVYASQTECSKELEIPISTINACLKGRIKETRGWSFYYET